MCFWVFFWGGYCLLSALFDGVVCGVCCRLAFVVLLMLGVCVFGLLSLFVVCV